MNKLLPPNPINGEGCIRYPNERKEPQINPNEHKCSEKDYNNTVQQVERLLKSLLDEYTSSTKEGKSQQVDGLSHENNSEIQFHRKLHRGISDIIIQSKCWSSYGLSSNNSMFCSPFHLVFALGDLAGISYFPKLDNEAMKELTRHWAICHPKKTLILAPLTKKVYMNKSWAEWVDTYKYWGGEIEFIEVNIKAMGWNVSVGPVSKL